MNVQLKSIEHSVPYCGTVYYAVQCWCMVLTFNSVGSMLACDIQMKVFDQYVHSVYYAVQGGSIF